MAELSYHEKMAKDAAVRAKILFEGRADVSPHPRVVVESSRRREVESFAARLRGYQPPSAAEMADYARMDASAMLENLSQGNRQVLAELQNAILNQDMSELADTLDRHRVGLKSDRYNLRVFLGKQDREAVAAVLRIITRSVVAGLREQTEEIGAGQVDVGLEIGNRTLPVMGTRRAIDTTYLTGINVHYPAPFRKPANTNAQACTMSAIEIGEAADDWEYNQQYHPMVLDAANASNDLMAEAAGFGKLDGRLSGGPNPWES